MSKVFVLWHSYETEVDCEEEKFIGVYSSRENAVLAIERLRGQPGFCETLDGFEIQACELDKGSWSEGFFISINDELSGPVPSQKGGGTSLGGKIPI